MFNNINILVLLSIQIDKALFAAAVACADSKKAAATTNGVSRQAVVERPRLRLKTRLNGKHEWKWSLLLDDTFGKVTSI